MRAQKIACEAILKALKEDLAKKGSKKKKVDHWKPFACASMGIKKMGQARWGMILDYGCKQNLFKKEPFGKKFILTPMGTPSQLPLMEEETQEEETQEEETQPQRDSKGYLPSDYATGSRLKISATRPRSIKKYAHRAEYAPREGDVLWAICHDGRIIKSEIEEVTFGLHISPLNKKDGHWSYVSSNDVFDSKKEAKAEANRREEERQKLSTSPNKFWSKDAMSQEEYALFKEYEDNREEFLKFKEGSIDLGLDDLLEDI
jgi:hypothetical protein